MARRIVVSGLMSCAVLAAGSFAVTALAGPEASSAASGALHPTPSPSIRPAPSYRHHAAGTGGAASGRHHGQATTLPSAGAPSAHAPVPAAASPEADGVTKAARVAQGLKLSRTLPPGSVLPTASACAAAVRRSTWEPRPGNRAANDRTPPAGWVQQPFRGFTREAQKRIVPRVDGDFTGTTDEILQWAACKWGFDVDTVRAQAVSESNWRMSVNGDGGTSWGILQIKPSAHPGTWPWARNSTAYNVDYTLARRRACYEGWSYDGARTRGDLWGCIGVWYSGSYGYGYSDYVASVRYWYRTKPWHRW